MVENGGGGVGDVGSVCTDGVFGPSSHVSAHVCLKPDGDLLI